ncbi:MAG: hypothetical protein SFX72_11640 [Isosphaeraceae bacterium]|nr:hypothetical protein [Isosphaeraceae bacterium]
MSLFTRFYETIRSWRRPRAAVKNRNKAEVRLEQLDHRQLLAVNFTGNVAVDFPASLNPGVVVLPNNPSVVHPNIPPSTASIIKVSGLDISGIRVSYTAEDDTLSIGLEQPDNQTNGRPVLAGDTDNNGNSADVNPAVLAIEPAFKDFPDLGGSETMGAFFDLNNDGTPDIVAGISNDLNKPKQYIVADAVNDPNNPGSIPGFGTILPFAGNVYLVNDIDHPAFQFAIKNFSQLYQQKTGLALTPGTNIQVGAFGNSGDDIGISEAFFPAAQVNIGRATRPTEDCPPANPPILINPHSGRHINTAHQTNIRVNIFSTSDFDATQIDPATVRLGGAAPVATFTRRVPGYPFPMQTFVFNGIDVDLPPGVTIATVTGSTFAGKEFESSIPVFNRDDSFYNTRSLRARDNRLGRTSASALNDLAAEVAAAGGVSNVATVSTPRLDTIGLPADPAPTNVEVQGNTTTVTIQRRRALQAKHQDKVTRRTAMKRAASNDLVYTDAAPQTAY